MTASVPPGIQVEKGEDGSISMVLPISQDRFLRWFLPLFGLPFIWIGLQELIRRGEPVSLLFLFFGLLIEWFGFYLSIGKVELRLGPDRVEWSRLYLRRWPAKVLERGRITGIGTSAGVRTNGRPTSWTLHFILSPDSGRPAAMRPERRQVPGFHAEAVILWLGGILSTWSQTPFDGKLDRSIDLSD